MKGLVERFCRWYLGPPERPTEFEIRLIRGIEAWPDRKASLGSANLPKTGDPGPPTCTLTREQMVKFRGRYNEMLLFISRHYNIRPEEITPLHLIADVLREVNARVDPDYDLEKAGWL